MSEITLASGRITLEKFLMEIYIVISCPTDEEADLTFSAIAEAWKRNNKLVLTSQKQKLALISDL